MRFGCVCLLLIVAGTVLSPASTLSGSVDREPEVPYDAHTVIHILGVVLDVREVAEPTALKSIHVTIRTEKEVITVYLAPAPFLKAFAINLAKGDQLQLAGSKIRVSGADLVLAKEFRRNTDILILRDDQGNPYWEDEILKRSIQPASTERKTR